MSLALVYDSSVDDYEQSALPIEGLPVDDKDVLMIKMY